MRILLTNHSLAGLGGTEMWTLTMAEELSRRGHDVVCYTFMTGAFADRIPAHVTTEKPFGAYDLILANHCTCVAQIQRCEGFRIFTQHGPTHRLEHSPPGMDAYVAVSEEVQSVQAMYGIASTVIRNPLDLDRYSVNETSGENILVMCRNWDATKIACKACDDAGLQWEYGHVTERPILPPEEIPHYDAVITSGRGVYEALACNKPVFIFDRRSGKLCGDGWVTPENIEEIRQYNCSGRSPLMPNLTQESFAECLSYLPPSWGREYAEEHHDVRKTVDRYLAIMEEQHATEERQRQTA